MHAHQVNTYDKMSETQPLPHPRLRLRSDLIISTQQTQNQTIGVIKDPKTGRYFRFGEAEFFIAQQFDASNSLQTIQALAEKKFNAQLDQQTITGFLQNLTHLGLLESPHTSTPTSNTNHRPKVRGSLLYLRFKAFDPDHLLSNMLPYFRFCYTKAFLSITLLLIAAAAIITITNAQRLANEAALIFHPGSFLIIWLAAIIITAFHEFAHGLTCKAYGGRVNEMGFMFLYFQPALYCNISDAWLFPEKSKRLWVTFAGAYFEWILWALATISWRFAAPGTNFHAASMLVMAAAGIMVLINFNPLIKLDGYYMLSDYLEIPNLRTRAFAHLRSKLIRIFTTQPKQTHYNTTPRLTRIYTIYAILSTIYCSALLGLIAQRFGTLLTDRLQGTGFILFLALLTIMLTRPIKKIMAKKNGSPEQMTKKHTKTKRRLIYATVAVSLMAVAWFVHLPLKISGQFTIHPTDKALVRSQVTGIISAILAEEGDHLQANDPIAELAGQDLRAQLDTITANIEQATADLDLLITGPTRHEIDLAQKHLNTASTKYQHLLIRLAQTKKVHAEQLTGATIAIEKASERVKYATQDLDTLNQLFKRDAVSPRELTEARELVVVRNKELLEAQSHHDQLNADELAEIRAATALAESELNEALSKLDLLHAGTRPEQILAASAAINALEAQQNHLIQQIQHLNINTPIAGLVATPHMKEMIGQLVQKGDLIAEIQQTRTVTAEILISEKQIADIQIGQTVILKARAHPTHRFEATVTDIATNAYDESPLTNGSTIRVTTEIDNPNNQLKPGMTGHAKIICPDQPILQLIARRFLRYIRVEFWSWW